MYLVHLHKRPFEDAAPSLRKSRDGIGTAGRSRMGTQLTSVPVLTFTIQPFIKLRNKHYSTLIVLAKKHKTSMFICR